MTQTATLRTRLESADPSALCDPGPAGQELRRSLLVGARIGVIEPGYATKRFLYERAHLYGVELVLIGDPSSWARSLVAEGIAAEFVAADTSGELDHGSPHSPSPHSRARQRSSTASSRSGRTRFR